MYENVYTAVKLAEHRQAELTRDVERRRMMAETLVARSAQGSVNTTRAADRRRSLIRLIAAVAARAWHWHARPRPSTSAGALRARPGRARPVA